MRNRRILIRLLITAGIAIALCLGAYLLMNARGVQLAGKIVTHSVTNQKKIALTFDDGPSKDTDEILAMLNKLGVKCTFFLTGEAIENDMDAAKAIAAAGHQIGNHSYSHERMVFKSAQWIENEIDNTNALIREIGYEGEIHFRPPYCKKLLLLPFELEKRGMATVTWNVETMASGTSEVIVKSVVEQAQPGAIILLHIMYSEKEREALPGIVNALRDQGYEFVTVNELLLSS